MELIEFVEIIGTVAFAMSGALVAINKDLDYYGIVTFAIITSVGGGIIRDILINENLPTALANPLYISISILSAIFVILFYSKMIHLNKVLQVLDALGLSAFTAIGAGVAPVHNLQMPFVIITLAVLTGTGGGVLRDVFAKEIPYVFRKEIYAVASIAGALVFIPVYNFLGSEPALYASFGTTLALRLISMRYNVHIGSVKA
ncbi:MAG: hypothetical protein AVO33_09815 [delta proteobacterium ML8_F1]|nr:MAG: hypothetical protein AVO33_09815 [delta proteobacterium ML8_F1]